MPTSPLALHTRQAYSSYIGPTVALPIGAVSAETNGLGSNPSPLAIDARYSLYCPETAIYLRQGGPGVSASPVDEFLARRAYRLLNTATGANRLAAITAQMLGGNLYVTRIDSIDGSVRGNAAVQQAAFFAPVVGRSVQVVAGGASARSAALVHGARYAVYCPQIDPAGVDGQAGDDVWLLQGGSSVAVAASGANLGMPLPLGTSFTFNVDDATNDRVAVLSASGGNGSSIWITRLDSVA